MQGIIDVFIRLSLADIVIEEDFVKIQLFTVLTYDVTSQTETVKKKCGNIPPTEGALRQHLSENASDEYLDTVRNCNQIYQMQSTGDRKSSNSECDDNTIEPLLAVLPQASDEGSELIGCRCKTCV
ncbi:hypothetical protein JTB14_023199 [Gonioctena quinquepunctata]|nr:hypothetical protein JTB14_023199 [Gonioctena quinquepunctata]